MKIRDKKGILGVKGARRRTNRRVQKLPLGVYEETK
jgi:hypothetical protein